MVSLYKTYSSSAKYAVTNSSNVDYINPVGTFTSTLATNSNGVVTGMSFVQVP